uniref:Gustatory receptor n=1 Tax=Tetranychus urticae TaxID=32264 RepID=T1KAI8_TETUR
MSQIHLETQSDDYHRPSGLLSRSLQTFNKTKLLLLQLSFFATQYNSNVVNYKPTTFKILDSVFLSWLSFNSILYFIMCLYLIFKRKSYTKFVDYFNDGIGNYAKNDHIRKFIAKNRIVTKIHCSFIFIVYLIYGILNISKSYNEPQPYGQLAFKLFMDAVRAIVYMNRFVLIEFIVESCLHVQICFKMVSDQIESLIETDGLLRFEELQKVRQLYDIAVKKTRKLDSLLFMVLPAYYLACLVSYELHFAALINKYDHIHLIIIVREALTLIFVILYVANINRLANKQFNRVYSLSYKAHSLEIMNEIRYFLTRIRRNDVGLTLLKIVLITPAFVTSIATISLTIALSIPTIFRKN